MREADSIDAVEDSISVEDAWVTIWVDSIGKTDPRDAVSTGTDWGETDPTEADWIAAGVEMSATELTCNKRGVSIA